VRVSRHGRLGLFLCAVEDGDREAADRRHRFEAGVGDVEAQSGRHLVVARTAGVDLAADRAEQALDCRVDVLVVWLDGALDGDPVERRLDVGELRVGEEPALVQAAGVNTCGETVVRKQLGIVGTQEVPDRLRHLALDASGPERHATRTSLRAATSCVSSAVIPMKPAAASCGKVSPMP